MSDQLCAVECGRGGGGHAGQISAMVKSLRWPKVQISDTGTGQTLVLVKHLYRSNAGAAGVAFGGKTDGAAQRRRVGEFLNLGQVNIYIYIYIIYLTRRVPHSRAGPRRPGPVAGPAGPGVEGGRGGCGPAGWARLLRKSACACLRDSGVAAQTAGWCAHKDLCNKALIRGFVRRL